jgi:periplasmic copper chaperone A
MIPQGVTNVKPRRLANWTTSLTMRKLATPITTDGVTVDDEVDTVTWNGAELPDEFYEAFGFQVKLPATAVDGDKFYFPVIQKCVVGQSNWTAIPKAGETLGHDVQTAPYVTIMKNGTLSQFNATQANASSNSDLSTASGFYAIGVLFAVVASL